ncbi:MAG: hypothetical protein IM650_10935 [Phenylobacterium sp.]|uniref:hypothetical protein n=1 Tax=Phenylobacterium sp. TaxID=1871053 RepID=UPI0025E6BF74|nr:hypothetical protein [Phenylobacterium sp.]MCA3186515.1 hypothetical protein [Cupriavidus sp.]MCA6225582.1 hypothetical protein [Phenylobacterium sp.]MCA6232440.1 hypothetical protein [Phenylobacterium sp.]MCA6251854.1 hypothetical protein [Phenylobacterium sp.]MCA6258594.1 hypothetical protein [Phenylobacterium sp.]
MPSKTLLWLPLAATLALVAACSPPLPSGVDPDALKAAVGDAVGDPNTCVLIAEAGTGRIVWRYGSSRSCGTAWPACSGTEVRTVEQLMKTAGREGAEIWASCPSNADRSRTVAWAAGPVPGRPELVFTAVMEGAKTPPGIVLGDKLRGALERGGLSPAR